MPPRYILETDEEFQAWVTSYFAQRQEVVKLVCVPVTQDSGSEEVGVTFTAYAYCMKQITQEKRPCKVSWRVQGSCAYC